MFGVYVIETEWDHRNDIIITYHLMYKAQERIDDTNHI